MINLPTSKDYQPHMPWVYKWDSNRNRLPGYFGTYIDDIRSVGSTEEHCYEVTHQTGSRINFLGQQDASRKRGQPSQRPRPWAGAKCLAKPGIGIFVVATQKKWDKTKNILETLYRMIVLEEERVLQFFLFALW